MAVHPADVILRIDGAPCPSDLPRLKHRLRGAVGSTVELTVQVAGSSSAEGVRAYKILRRVAMPTRKAEVSEKRMQPRLECDHRAQTAAAVFEKLLRDAAAAGDDEMTAALQAQMREEESTFV